MESSYPLASKTKMAAVSRSIGNRTLHTRLQKHRQRLDYLFKQGDLNWIADAEVPTDDVVCALPKLARAVSTNPRIVVPVVVLPTATTSSSVD